VRFLPSINALALVALLVLLPESARAEAAAQEAQKLQKECDAKDWQSCVVLGYHYLNGEGVPKDPVKGGALQQRACDAGYGGGCVSVAFLWEDGALGNDLAKVVRLRNRGCDLKDGGGCHHLGKMYLEGRGVPENVARGVKLIERACDELEEGDACIELQLMLEKGDVIPKDQKRADAYYERGCDLMATLCVMVFNEYLNTYEAACAKGRADLCNELGNIHLDGESYLKPNEVEAAKWFQKACDLKLTQACGLLGWLHEFGKEIPKDLKKAGPYYEKSCSPQYPYGCMMLGLHQLDGSGVPKDERRAADSLRAACNANKENLADACWVLADMYRKGTGVAMDPARASILDAQACRLGLKEACAAPAQAVAATPAGTGCQVVKVQVGKDTFASVQRDIKRRGGDASGGGNNGKPVLNAMSGDFSDVWPAVMNVGYTFEAEGASARLIGVMIVTHANSSAEFEKLRAARQAASAAVVKAAGATCATRLVPNADTWFVHEFYELRSSP
jgi:uncharacterized protein